jgi:hypothetical protein
MCFLQVGQKSAFRIIGDAEKPLDHALPGSCMLEQSPLSRLHLRRIKRIIALPREDFPTLRVVISPRHCSFGEFAENQ